MTDTPKYYTTARPVTMDELGAWFTNEYVKEPLFQPLDVESLTTQLEEIISSHRSHDSFDEEGAVAEVLELIGITKEQK